MITYEFDLDMVPGAPKIERHLNQYDSDFTFVISLKARCGTFSLQSGTTAVIRGTKPDGNGYSADATVDVSAGTVTVTGDEQITAVAGKSLFEIALYNDAAELSSANFWLIVERAALDRDTITSESVIRELVGLADDLEEIAEAGRSAQSNAEKVEAAAKTVEDFDIDAELESIGLVVVDGVLCYAEETEES